MKDFLHRLFFPQTSNNFRPGILHHKFLFVAILLLFSAGLLTTFIKSNYPSVLGISSDISNQQLLILTNQQRQENNLPVLTDNQALDQAAANKAADMFSKDYWAHIAPDGTTPWAFIKAAGYNYVYAGENLAKGFNSASDVVNAWMASPEHKANILSSNYKDVGFAVQTGTLNGEDTVLVVEMLGNTTLSTVPIANEKNNPAEVAVASSLSGKQNTTLGTQNQNSLPKTNLISVVSIPAVKPLIDSLSFSSFSAEAVLSLFILILVLDMIVIERRKIVRFVGHNLDHVLFLCLIFIIILILAKGSII